MPMNEKTCSALNISRATPSSGSKSRRAARDAQRRRVLDLTAHHSRLEPVDVNLCADNGNIYVISGRVQKNQIVDSDVHT